MTPLFSAFSRDVSGIATRGLDERFRRRVIPRGYEAAEAGTVLAIWEGMSNTVRFLGTSDQITACDCCGRENLKSTVKLDVGNGLTHFGVGCAAKALRMGVAQVKAATKAVDDASAEAARVAADAKHAAFMAEWAAFLDAQVPAFRGRIVDQLAAMGGMVKARAMFNAERGA